MSDITPLGLLVAARQHGLTALGVPPRANWPCKILLASLGIDVSDWAVQARLVEFLRLGPDHGGILIDRVDRPEVLVPADRRSVYQASRFWHLCCWFDCLVLPGEQLLGTAVR